MDQKLKNLFEKEMTDIQKFDIMIGIGCGYPEGSQKTPHDHHFPIDVVNFLGRADDLKQAQERAEQSPQPKKGVIVLADIGVNNLRAIYRRNMLLRILEVTGIKGWTLLQQTLLPGREDIGEIRLSNRVPEASLDYFRREAEDVRILLRQGGIKVGWALGLKKRNIYGGEKPFDEEIEETWPNTYHYTYLPSGIPIDDTNGPHKPPYLVKRSELENRVCITKKTQHIGEEINKILARTPTRSAIEAIYAFCGRSGISPTEEPFRVSLEKALRLYATED